MEIVAQEEDEVGVILSKEELTVICRLVGNISGATEARKVASGIYREISNKFSDYAENTEIKRDNTHKTALLLKFKDEEWKLSSK